MPQKRGKLIVIDGIDGSGKATQTELLVNALTRRGLKVKKIDFPRYETNFFGHFVGECLTGKWGDFISLHPRVASVFYAADRFESKTFVENWLKQGYIVITDRYVSSNQIHQGGKIKHPKQRKEFLVWLDAMEHEIFGLPRPDAVIYLDIPVDVSVNLLRELKIKSRIGKKVYLRGRPDKKEKIDLAEGNIEYLENSRKSALSLIRSEKGRWHKIDCIKKGHLLSIAEINDEVVRLVKYIIGEKN